MPKPTKESANCLCVFGGSVLILINLKKICTPPGEIVASRSLSIQGGIVLCSLTRNSGLIGLFCTNAAAAFVPLQQVYV